MSLIRSLRGIAAQLLDPTRSFPAGLGAYWTLIMGAQSRFGTAVFDETGRSQAERRRSGFGERPFWGSIDEHPGIGTHWAAPGKPALWTQSASACRHFAAETLGEMALASTNPTSTLRRMQGHETRRKPRVLRVTSEL